MKDDNRDGMEAAGIITDARGEAVTVPMEVDWELPTKEESTIFPTWFGKNCPHFHGTWEEDEITGGPNFEEYEPCLVFCGHDDNKEDVEGNCREAICPLGKKEERGTNDEK